MFIELLIVVGIVMLLVQGGIVEMGSPALIWIVLGAVGLITLCSYLGVNYLSAAMADFLFDTSGWEGKRKRLRLKDATFSGTPNNLSDWEVAIKEHPKNAELSRKFCDYLAVHGAWTRLISEKRRILSEIEMSGKEQESVLHRIADAYLQVGDAKSAVLTLQEIVDKAPQSEAASSARHRMERLKSQFNITESETVGTGLREQ